MNEKVRFHKIIITAVTAVAWLIYKDLFYFLDVIYIGCVNMLCNVIDTENGIGVFSLVSLLVFLS